MSFAGTAVGTGKAGATGASLRLLATLGMASLLALTGRVLLPGLDPDAVRRLLDQAAGGRADVGADSFSVFALGLGPFLSGFVVVELAAAAVPRWRPLRSDGLTGRVRLRAAAVVTSLLFALLQGFFLGRWLERADANLPGLQLLAGGAPAGFSLLVAMTLAAGTAALWVLAGLIDRVGLGAGASVLVGVSAGLGLWREGAALRLALASGALSPLAALGEVAVVAAAAVATGLAVRPPPDEQTAPPLPVTSLVPLNLLASLTALLASLGSLGWLPASLSETLAPGRPAHLLVGAALLVATGLPLGWLFSGPPPELPADRRRQVVALSLAYLFGLWALSLAPRLVGWPPGPSVLLVAVATAVALDLAAEWRARTETAQPLTRLWTCPSPAAALAARHKLQAGGVATTVRSLRHRSLWQIFGAAFALDLMVPADQAERAVRILSGDEEPQRTGGEALPARPSATPARSWAPVGLGLLAVGLAVGVAVILRGPTPPPVLRLLLEPAGAQAGALQADLEVVRRRADGLGIRGVRVTRQGGLLAIELPALPPAVFERVRHTLLRDGRLELRPVERGSAYMRRLERFLVEQPVSGVTVVTDYFQAPGGAAELDPYLRAQDPTALDRMLATLPPELQVPADHELLYGQDEQQREALFRSYYLPRQGALTGDAISDAEVVTTPDGMPEVALTFDDAGAARLAELTAAMHGQLLAIILERRVMSAPLVQGTISGGRARISLGAARPREQLRQEALDLLAVLRSGALPVPLRLVREEAIGPAPR